MDKEELFLSVAGSVEVKSFEANELNHFQRFYDSHATFRSIFQIRPLEIPQRKNSTARKKTMQNILRPGLCIVKSPVTLKPLELGSE